MASLSDKKIYILLPDGIGLRNFIYTDFLKYGNAVVWTPLDYLDGSIAQKRLPKYTATKSTDILKSALIKSNILFNYERTGNPAFLNYIFPPNSKNLKIKTKQLLIDLIAKTHTRPKSIGKLRHHYMKSLRKSSYYKECQQQLKEAMPSFVFCTNQRMVNAAAPILAARDLGIPTGTFIFSWDNLPKGNISVPAEHLFVWSEHMKQEALEYFPFYKAENIHVVGTPQFIPYTDKSLYETRETFCKKYGLDPMAKIICFSGDDITTSPHDPIYLEDTAKAVRRLNVQGNTPYQILFRRCPVDTSGRYDDVIEKYSDVIRSVPPLWKQPENSAQWNAIIPTPEDVKLLLNTVLHCETAINVGSTIAHDFACMEKTSCYFNYNPVKNSTWDIHKIYTYIHFQSMNGLDPVYWANSPDKIADTLQAAMDDSSNKLKDAKQWLRKIVLHPLNNANQRIWHAIDTITGSRV